MFSDTAGTIRSPPFFNSFAGEGCVERRYGVPGHRERTEGERPVSGPNCSDGKPCSGVRGGQGASTEFSTGADAPGTLPCKGKTLQTERFLRAVPILQRSVFL